MGQVWIVDCCMVNSTELFVLSCSADVCAVVLAEELQVD
jgi:hypothetical protein